jgi:hypothetical protein
MLIPARLGLAGPAYPGKLLHAEGALCQNAAMGYIQPTHTCCTIGLTIQHSQGISFILDAALALDLALIFQPFERVEKPTPRRQRNTCSG